MSVYQILVDKTHAKELALAKQHKIMVKIRLLLPHLHPITFTQASNLAL